MLSEEARQQAQAEGLTLRVAENKTGFLGVYLKPSRTKPYLAQLKRGGKDVSLGSFATAEEAALCVARSPEGQAAARTAAAAVAPLTSDEARQQAQAEGLTLLVAENKTGYFGVRQHPGRPKPYLAQVSRGGKDASLGSFATAEEAALCIARSPEGQAAAAEQAAAAPPLTSDEARRQAQVEGLTLLVAENKTGYFGVTLTHPGRPKPYQAQLRHRRGGGAVHRAVAGGAGGGGEGSSGAAACAAAADDRGGAAAGAGGGADAARGRQQGGLLLRHPSVRQDQALRGAGEARWQDGVPGPLRHRRGGGAARRAIAGGAEGGGVGGSGTGGNAT
eukprot:scaffold5333_cov56-Phaeocystis_antarctica.AAC.1